MATTNTEEVIDIKVTVRNKERFLENLGNDDSVINFEVTPKVVTMDPGMKDSKDLDQPQQSDSPKEIAAQMKMWQSSKNVSQSDLAKYLGRAKSTISDLLKTSQEVMPAGHGKTPWLSIK